LAELFTWCIILLGKYGEEFCLSPKSSADKRTWGFRIFIYPIIPYYSPFEIFFFYLMQTLYLFYLILSSRFL